LLQFVWRGKPWLKPVANRLWSYESTETFPWATRVLVRPEDDLRSAAALRHAKFNPFSFVRIPAPPPDAPDLLTLIQVVRPTAWHEQVSDEQRAEDVADVFRRAFIRARVSGIDVLGESLPGDLRSVI
jgi:hypothetical protein